MAILLTEKETRGMGEVSSGEGKKNLYLLLESHTMDIQVDIDKVFQAQRERESGLQIGMCGPRIHPAFATLGTHEIA